MAKPPAVETPSPARSANMRAIRSRGTAPELVVRAMLHALAPGYRLNRKALPGKPDMAYGRRKLAVFVNGCFWHGHDCARGARQPKTNADYWRAKIARNRERDARALAALEDMGWRCVTIWECEVGDAAVLRKRLRAALRRSS